MNHRPIDEGADLKERRNLRSGSKKGLWNVLRRPRPLQRTVAKVRCGVPTVRFEPEP